ncbi:MAG: restriction endonuclease (plasmid) [Burkholderia sp.]
MPVQLALLGVALAILALLVAAVILRPGIRARRHQYKQNQTRRVLAKINTIELMPQRLAYLRKIDPLTFEELLLEAFELRGYRVYRNARYTGDGGADGAVVRDGRLYLVQAKRYGRYINRSHVAPFCQLLDRRHCYGFFFNTGRTGPGVRELARSHLRLTILSGQRLLDFLSLPPAQQEHTHGALGNRDSMV